MPRATYSASFPTTRITGGGGPTPNLGTLVRIPIHVYCSQVSTSPGSAVQVDVSWTNDGAPDGDTIVISLDSIPSKDVRTIDMWTDYNDTDISLAATLIGDGQFGIDWCEERPNFA